MTAAMWCAIGAVLVWTGCLSGVPSVFRGIPRPRKESEERPDVWSTVIESIATAVRSGTAPSVACAAACSAAAPLACERDRASLELLRSAAARGDDLPQVWRTIGQTSDDPGLRTVAGAWQLSDTIGAPLADALTVAGALRRSETERAARAAAALAAPTASVNLLTILPLAGAGLGVLLGLDVQQVYLSSLALVTVLPGIVLIALGRLWCRRMVSAAGRPRSLR
ncbi:hypothetical protein [Yimella sp. cx-51]|uniref:hypothetical protein n=1 Tax=Yimella sp. cx-51 TaxID=2770551 RepID=UPI00165D6A64|nr:hypothetical protein [Yimella sp. cx-51]MBC9956422.1 hypothetical protein [Yimella sp. cx-51]QTH38460.1 hypothetical protein J5M86_01930 [Yimella sp. cx-51]